MNITTPPLHGRKEDRRRTSSLRRRKPFAKEDNSRGETNQRFLDGTSELHQAKNENAIGRAMIGVSPLMKNIYSLIKRLGKTTSSVLITGESGTGKELVARAVHYAGASEGRGAGSDKQPFVAINCGAIPAGLIESELFGHEKGAFTGASLKKTGKVELARGGTLFLDEIATLPLSMQVKLLRFLQERTFTPVGSNTPVRVELRVIAAANVNLREAVQRAEFREDLYYRLNVVPIEVPALRERRDDIVLLAEHFLLKYKTKYSRSIEGISPEAIAALSAYNWPGNVRELENIMERLVVLSSYDGLIERQDLPVEILRDLTSDFAGGSVWPVDNYKEALRSFERSYITTLLDKTGWNRAQTARLMNVHRNTLLMKMKALDIHNF